MNDFRNQASEVEHLSAFNSTTGGMITSPSLVSLQLDSFKWLVEKGLADVFSKFSPMEDFGGKTFLEFGKHRIGPPKRSIRECQETEASYEAPLYVHARLVDRTSGEVKESEVYLGDMPYMTEKGTFLINGAERVVVSQLARSPGVYFKSVLDVSGRELYSAQIIPDHGNWVDFEMDAQDVIRCRIGQGKRFPATVLLKALSSPYFPDLAEPPLRFKNDADIITHFATEVTVSPSHLSPQILVGKRVRERVIHPHSGEVLLPALGLIDAKSANVIVELKIKGINYLEVPHCIEATLKEDPTEDSGDAIPELFRRIKLSEAPNRETAVKILSSYFFDNRRYDLAMVGRFKINSKLGINLPPHTSLLTKEDVSATLSYMAALVRGQGEVDEIDHLANKRVRAAGELLLEQFRVGLSRVEKIARERMSTLDQEKMVPSSVINFKPLQAAIRSFFGSGQLSQFMDEVNPLAELTHKRKLSSLGPGGLSRRSAKLEVRDVHHSHYGRICPIETPEGQNVGLLGSLTVMARIDEHGFIQTPYYKVVNGRITDQIDYLSSAHEDKYFIAPADAPRDNKGRIEGDRVTVRHRDGFPAVPPSQVDYIDVSPKQIFSLATTLIPFLENDEPTRGLMGANMQRQAVPLLKPKASAIRTGMEGVAARDSAAVVVAKRRGRVRKVEADRIVVDSSPDSLTGQVLAQSIQHPSTGQVIAEAGTTIDEKLARRIVLSRVDFVKTEAEDIFLPVLDEYELLKFHRTNNKTCVNQKPLVREGQVLETGQVIADGACTEAGRLALGRDVLVAYMPWMGYNYEDAIVVSERLVKEDVLTSVQIEKYETSARDTKVGPEEITRDIPTIGEEALKNLDDEGVVFVGAEVSSDDILVGKIAPKGPSELSPEEQLIVAIFSKKAEEMRDVSLRMPYGERGTVITRRVFSRHLLRCPACEFTFDEDPKVERPYCPKCGTRVEQVVNDNLPAGVNKLVRAFVAQKRKVAVGDKLAGRHGNKGVIAKILPQEDMPFLPDGTPVDVILNPLSVPSRMNVGQTLETHLGLIAKERGQEFEIPVFEGMKEDALYGLLQGVTARSQAREIKRLCRQELDLPLEDQVDPTSKEVVSEVLPAPVLRRIEEMLARLPLERIEEIAEELAVPPSHDHSPKANKARIEALSKAIALIAEKRSGLRGSAGRSTLYDGRTGEPFNLPVVVGHAHIMKLMHLVEDKIHARSTGPYSLVTQQPLGGKSQMGGQRFGEMEVWALEAYGAAHALQEILTVKSDDVDGRAKTYEALVKGENLVEGGIPESFVVLVKELQSLGLDVTVGADNGMPIEFFQLDEEPPRHGPF